MVNFDYCSAKSECNFYIIFHCWFGWVSEVLQEENGLELTLALSSNRLLFQGRLNVMFATEAMKLLSSARVSSLAGKFTCQSGV